jgi:hypothetical protein
VQQNILRVTRHIADKLRAQGVTDISRRTLTLILTHDGEPVHHDAEGNWWRMYVFVEGAKTYDQIQSTAQAELVGEAFADFQNMVADLTEPRLHETIPNFHNTVKRYETLVAAIEKDAFNRAKDVKAEIDFVQKMRHIAPVLLDYQAKGEIPERITHNDTKINNVMLDDESGEAIFVIDLDTIMPGISLYDFGDLVRTSTSPAAEDEKDLSKVYARMEMFEALAKGFLEGADGCLTEREVEMMPFSGMLITFEIGVRFITDYLAGDKYFKVKREEHNLDRCRTQFKLVQSLMEQEDEMKKIMERLVKA